MNQGLIRRRLWKPGRMATTPEEHAVRADMLIRDGVEYCEAVEQSYEAYLKAANAANFEIEKLMQNARNN